MNLGGFSELSSRKAGDLRMPPLEGGEDEFLDHLKPKPLAQSWNKAYQHKKAGPFPALFFPTSSF